MLDLMKKHKWKAILSSLMILLPIAAGMALWDSLPERMIVHWGADGAGDGSGPKVLAVFGVPLLILAVHWVCLFFTAADPQNRGRNQKAMGLIFWISPMISLVTAGLLYSTALGRDANMEQIVLIMLAVLFIVLGNYLPKISQNSTLGIKLPWTLFNEENWNKTHRMGGKLWVAGGFVLLMAALLPQDLFLTVMLVDIIVLAVVPILYSYILYRKQLKTGEFVPMKRPASKSHRTATAIGTGIGVIILAACALLMFTGNIDVRAGRDSFTIEADYYTDITVRYADIDSIEFQESCEPGLRTNGFGSPRLLMGTFKNEAFGSYTRYTYTDVRSCVLLRDGEHVLVIGGRDEDQSKAIYEELRSHISK